MPDGVTIENIQIKINQDSATAVKGIESLAETLQGLKTITTGGIKGLNTVSRQIEKLNTAIASMPDLTNFKQLRDILAQIKGLGNIDISSIVRNSGASNDLVSQATDLKDSVADAVKVYHESRTEIGEMSRAMEESHSAEIDDLKTECEDIVKSYETSSRQIESARQRLQSIMAEKQDKYGEENAFIGANYFVGTLDDKFKKLGVQADILHSKMEKLGSSDDVDVESWERLQVQLLGAKVQYTQLEQAVHKHSRRVEELGESMNKTRKPLGKLIAQFGRVAVYRGIRLILSEISQGVTTGLQNLAKFSKEANSTMSAYQADFLYIKNSLGSALIPYLQLLVPMVDFLADRFVDVANTVGVIGAGLNGEETFIKAKKYAQDYKKSLDDIKKSTVSFDEINILSKVDTNNDYTQMFEEVEVSSGEISSSIASVAQLAGTIGSMLLLFKSTAVLKGLKEWVKGLEIFKSGKLSATNLKNVATAIGAVALQGLACYGSFYDMFTSADSVGDVLLDLIPIIATTTASFFALKNVVGGPWAAAISLAVTAITALIAGVKASNEAIKENALDSFYKDLGEGAISLEQLYDAYCLDWEDAASSLTSAVENSKSAIDECRESMRLSVEKIDEYSISLDKVVGNYTSTISVEVKDNNELSELNSLIGYFRTTIDVTVRDDSNELADLSATLDSLNTLNSFVIQGKIELTDGDRESISEALNGIATGFDELADSLDNTIQTRIKGILENFTNLFKQSKLDFQGELNQMNASFSAFLSVSQGVSAGLSNTMHNEKTVSIKRI